MNPDAALDFLTFVEERHQAWLARQLGKSQPWSLDNIVNRYKFTNVFRILDPGTQFVMTDLAGGDPRDELMRLFLYRHTGRVEVWKHLLAEMGGYPTWEDLDDVLEVWQEYRGEFKVITSGNSTKGKPSRKGRISDRPIFTSAYLVFPQSQVPGTDKLESIVELTRRLFHPASVDDLVPDFSAALSQAERFQTLRRNKGVADFMSMQILTDWGYLHGSDEDEFVICGPGAVKGAKALAPSWKAPEVLLWAVNAVRSLPNPPQLPNGRLPSYMDTQNCLCEFSKYVRYKEKSLPVKPYKPAHPGPQTPPVLPQHW